MRSAGKLIEVRLSLSRGSKLSDEMLLRNIKGIIYVCLPCDVILFESRAASQRAQGLGRMDFLAWRAKEKG